MLLGQPTARVAGGPGPSGAARGRAGGGPATQKVRGCWWLFSVALARRCLSAAHRRVATLPSLVPASRAALPHQPASPPPLFLR